MMKLSVECKDRYFYHPHDQACPCHNSGRILLDLFETWLKCLWGGVGVGFVDGHSPEMEGEGGLTSIISEVRGWGGGGNRLH